MKITAHLFNPDNELALATGGVAYTPPQRVMAMMQAGALLPLWWGRDGDVAVGADEEALQWLKREYGIAGSLDAAGAACLRPWGWSREARRRYANGGVESALLPDDDFLATYRRLSHRRITIAMAKALGVEPPGECTGVDDIPDGAVVKSPWSASGKGVMFTRLMPREAARHQAAGVIARQGSVLVEPERRGVLDFAALYHIGTEAHQVGWSVFSTEAAGRYGGNLVASQSELCQRIDHVCRMADAELYARQLGEFLTEHVSPYYRGYAGVDMMALEDGSVWPVVELNLRPTMGVAAWAIEQKTGLCGRLVMSNSGEGITPVTPPGRQPVFGVKTL